MNCPICLKLNVYSEIVMLPGIYVCTNEMCEFFESMESFEKLNESTKYESPENYVSNTEFLYSENDIFKYQEIHEKSNELDSLFDTISNVGGSMLEFENNCNQLIANFDGSEYDICSLENSNNPINTNSACNESLKLSDIDIFNSYNDSKSEMVSKILSENYYINLNLNKNMIFNWLQMPNSFNTECKIIRILLLYLDVFKIDDNRFNEMKYEYSGIEIFGNNLSKDKIKPLCYNLMEKLYHTIDENKVENVAKFGYEVMLRILSNVFDKYDMSNKLELKYSTVDSCYSCGFINKLSLNNYFLKMERYNEVKENKFTYDSNCLRCNSKSSKRISLKIIPEFLIFYCPYGLENDINIYENQIRTIDNRKLCAVAVVEFASPLKTMKDCLLTRELYEISNTFIDSRSSPNYCVHFRNKNGWYSLNDSAPVLIKPTQHLSTNNAKDVKLVIFGTIPDRNVYYERFSLKQFIIKNEAHLSKEVLASCRSAELRNYCNDVIYDLNSRQNRNKKICKRKYVYKRNSTIDSIDLDTIDITKFSQQSIKNVNEEINSPITTTTTPSPSYSSGKSSNTNASSSGVSSSSSLFNTQTDALPPIIDSFNNPSRFIEHRKRPFSIDDLIIKHCRKLKKGC